MATVHAADLALVDEVIGQRETARERWLRRVPLLPALVFSIVVTQVPFVITIWYALHRWAFLEPGSFHFTGLKNFTHLWSNQFFREAAWHTVSITVFSVSLSVLVGLGLAIVLDRAFFGRGVARTLLITPFLVMPVAASLVWKNGLLDSTYGVLNWFLRQVHLGPVAFTTRYPLQSVVMVLVWQWTPFMMLIVLAGLQSQSGEVLEAANIDGSKPFTTFLHLTLPHLRPYLELGILLGSIYIVQAFDTVDQLVGGATGARNIPYFVYQRSIGGGWSFGEASAFGVVVVVVSIALATVALRVLSGLLKGEDIV